MKSTKQLEKETYSVLKDQFGYTNHMAAPSIGKVVVNSGTGKISRADKTRNELVADRLSKIVGQKAAPRGAKKSIASFKLREGEHIGFSATLRGQRMYDFLDRFLFIALPRSRDFRGIPRTAIDEMGNVTIGVPEHIVFPETSDEELKNVFGFAVTIVTTAKTKEEAEAFLEHIGVPFKKKKGVEVNATLEG